MKAVVSILLRIAVVVFVVFSLTVLPKKINKDNTQTSNVKTLELWHVDTFEGGIGSRKTLLQSLSKQFEKQYNIKVIVKSQTIYSCNDNFKKLIYPDLISYGIGINLPYDMLVQLDKPNHEIGCYDKKCYAKIWCSGGYVLISHKEQSQFDGVIVSVQQNTNPLLAYCLTNESAPKNAIYIDSKDAFYQFKNKSSYKLLATQRDIYRLYQKVECDYQLLTGYNDLFQYISVLSNDMQKQKMGKQFINFLTSEKTQNSTSLIGMVSYEYKNQYEKQLSIFSNKTYEDFNYYADAFYVNSRLKNLNEMCKNYDKNTQSIKTALKYLK